MAQLVEQRIRNAQVAGSSPATSSKRKTRKHDVCGFFFVPYTARTLGVYRGRFNIKPYPQCFKQRRYGYFHSLSTRQKSRGLNILLMPQDKPGE